MKRKYTSLMIAVLFFEYMTHYVLSDNYYTDERGWTILIEIPNSDSKNKEPASVSENLVLNHSF